jgi:uncharacterized damage-inducible protein DinB
MFRTIDDFITSWKYEQKATSNVFARLTDESLHQTVAEGGRSLGRLAWHIAQTIPEMMQRTGLTIQGAHYDANVPNSAQEIRDAYSLAAQSVADEITKNWNDESLLQEDNMYGELWTRGSTLMTLITHQAHHRGQITVLIRQAGLTVPGVYGPSKEEWVSYGMNPHQ